MAAANHCTTESALEPGADAQRDAGATSSQAVSRWSMPMVAVATKRTRLLVEQRRR